MLLNAIEAPSSFRCCRFFGCLFIVYCCPDCIREVCVQLLFYYAVLSVFSCFAITTVGQRELVALLYLFSRYHVAVRVLGLFLVASWVGLQCMIPHFPGHTCLLF